MSPAAPVGDGTVATAEFLQRRTQSSSVSMSNPMLPTMGLLSDLGDISDSEIGDDGNNPWLRQVSSFQLNRPDPIVAPPRSGANTPEEGVIGALGAANFWPDDLADEGGECGAPALRQMTGELSPDVVHRREKSMQEVAGISTKFLGKIERRREEAATRRRPRHKTAPSHSLEADAAKAAEETTAADPSPAGSTPAEDPAVIMFDWDDTLLPTWYITDVVRPCLAKRDEPLSPSSPFWEPLAAHARAVAAMLTAARQVARVAIITLAQRPWVDHSADIFLPELHLSELLIELDIPVYYAREHVVRGQAYAARMDEGVDMFMVAKRNAMVKCLRHIGPKHVARLHVLSIGDSSVELQAIKEVLWSSDEDSLCKTVKLMSDPPVQHLTDELQVITSWICQMVSYDQDFDLSMESAEDVANVAAAMFQQQ